MGEEGTLPKRNDASLKIKLLVNIQRKTATECSCFSGAGAFTGGLMLHPSLSAEGKHLYNSLPATRIDTTVV